jgi:hypothetical protein
MRHRTTIVVQHAAGHDNALTQRLAGVLARKVAVGFGNFAVPVHGACDL